MSNKSVVVDVDGVLFEYHGWVNIDHYGDPINENIEIINGLYNKGYDILIWTTRTNPRINAAYSQSELENKLFNKLKENGILFTEIIKDPKPFFVCIIDDLSWNPTSKKYLSDFIKDIK